MAVQTSYGFSFPKGVAGGLYDLSAHNVITRQAEGTWIAFGIGVVIGTNKGTDVKIPTSSTTSDDFEGVVVHNSVMVEKDVDNKCFIGDKRTVGCLHFGRIWVKTAKNAVPEYNKKVYMITDGDEAGMFTTSEDNSTKVEVNAVFIGETDTGIANAEFRPRAVMKTAD